MYCRRPNVGAGLLANAIDPSPLILTDTPLSRASPLPQVIGGESGCAFVTGTALKIPLVLATELRRALIPHPVRHLRHAKTLAQQQLLRPEQTQSLQILHRRQQGTALEMLMKRRRTHVRATGQ